MLRCLERIEFIAIINILPVVEFIFQFASEYWKICRIVGPANQNNEWNPALPTQNTIGKVPKVLQRQNMPVVHHGHCSCARVGYIYPLTACYKSNSVRLSDASVISRIFSAFRERRRLLNFANNAASLIYSSNSLQSQKINRHRQALF